MAPINWLEIWEWAKTIGGLFAVFVAVLTFMALALQVFMLFSAGKTGFGFLLLAAYLVGLYFCARWIRK